MSEFPTLHLLKHVVGVPVVLLAISMQCGCDYIPESPEPRQLHLLEHVVGVPIVPGRQLTGKPLEQPAQLFSLLLITLNSLRLTQQSQNHIS